MKNLLISIFAMFILFSCDRLDFIEGIGPVVEEELNMDDFNSIFSDSSIDVVIEQGPEQKVIARGQQNIIDRLRRNVANREWIIDLEAGNYRNFDLTVHITIPDLEALSIDGSGDINLQDVFELDNLDIKIDGSGDVTISDGVFLEQELSIDVDGSGNTFFQDVSAQKIDLFIDGSGEITLRGDCDEMEITISGSGDVMAFALEAQSIEIDSNASGDCEVFAQQNMVVNMDGSGDVLFKGDPTILSRINGSGRLIDAN